MSDNRSTSLFMIILSGLLLPLFWPAFSVGLNEPGRVLLISSYHPGFPTFYQQIDGVKSVLDREDILLDVEFMDSKRFVDKSSNEAFLKMLSGKLRRLPSYDVVMTADDNALGFLLDHKDQLFHDQPAVFFGVNNVRKALAQNESPSITGVVEAVSMRETIELMVHLLPGVDNVLALVDATPSGQGDLVLFHEMEQYFPKLAFRSLSLQNYSFLAFSERLRTIGEDTAVLLLSAYVDKAGNRFDFKDSLELILNNLRQPVFHLWYHGIGDGILGGKVISHYEQGRTAAEIVTRILEGEPVQKIPVVADSPNKIVFDYRVLKKFGLEKIYLPEETVILNKPESYYEQHKEMIWLVGGFCFLQTVVIIVLVNTIVVRRKVESELRESEERYFSLFSENHSVMLLIDPETSRLVDANLAASQYYGYSVEELVGKDLSDINMLTTDEIQEKAKDIRKSGARRLVLQHRLASGEIRDVEIYSGPITLHGQHLLYSIVHDITDRKKLEEQLRQAQKMEAIGTLAGGIAHDFNNILAAIIGFTELAIEDQPVDSQTRTYLENVRAAGNRAKELVMHILAFSRKASDLRTPVSIYDVVEEALLLLRASLPTTIEIRSHLDKMCGYVLADSIQIHQIVMNLCTNASQAMEDDGGVLSINLDCFECPEGGTLILPKLAPGTYVRLQVIDTGPGISPETLEKIFDPYFTTKDVGKGSGIGLAVVSGIVQNHGGAIHAASEPGKGTQFSVFLPRIVPPDMVSAHEAGTLPSGSEHILLVDDEPALVEMMRNKIERLGYMVTATSNSLEALQLFISNPQGFDLLLTDQTMPGLTGVEFAQHVKNMRKEMPVIIITGYSSKIDMGKADLLGVDAVFMKPVENDVLARTLRQLLDKSTSGALNQE